MPRPLSQAARKRAVDATHELMAEAGIGGCTLDAVAKRSGVAKTTLYRHWGSANVLLVHCIDCLIQRVPTPNTGSLQNDLLELLGTFRLVANKPGNRQMMLDVVAAATKDPDLAAAHNSLMRERMRPVGEVVKRAIDRGEIPPIDIEQATHFIQGPMMARIIKSHQPVEAADIPIMVTLIARGLGVVAPASAAHTANE